MECFYQETQQSFVIKPIAVVATWIFWIPNTKRQAGKELLQWWWWGGGNGT